jgi:hypothetical protein
MVFFSPARIITEVAYCSVPINQSHLFYHVTLRIQCSSESVMDEINASSIKRG